MAREKIRYEVDSSNRLKLPQFRYTLDGEFKVDKESSLVYLIKSKAPPGIPQQLKLTGSWSLDKENNLTLTLDKENNQVAGDKITLQSQIIKAGASRLEFLISAKDKHNQAHLYILSLSGIWQADKYNRLKFLAQKTKQPHDELLLSASWEVDRRNQIIYSYTKTNLKTKAKSRHNLTLKGFWDISEKKRLIYVLDKDTGSELDFTVSLAEPLKRGLRYELGVGIRPAKKKITLFGSWKLSKNIGLLFEMPVEEGKISAVALGAICRLGKNEELEFSLKNSLREDLGIKLKFSKIFAKSQGELFLRALKENHEVTFQAGMGFRW